MASSQRERIEEAPKSPLSSENVDALQGEPRPDDIPPNADESNQPSGHQSTSTSPTASRRSSASELQAPSTVPYAPVMSVQVYNPVTRRFEDLIIRATIHRDGEASRSVAASNSRVQVSNDPRVLDSNNPQDAAEPPDPLEGSFTGPIHPTAPYASRVLGRGTSHPEADATLRSTSPNQYAERLEALKRRAKGVLNPQTTPLQARAYTGGRRQPFSPMGDPFTPDGQPPSAGPRGPTDDSLAMLTRTPFRGARAGATEGGGCGNGGGGGGGRRPPGGVGESDDNGESSNDRQSRTSDAASPYSKLRGITPDGLTKVVSAFDGSSANWGPWSDRLKAYFNFYGMKKYLTAVEYTPPTQWDPALTEDAEVNQFLYDCLLLVLDPATALLIKTTVCRGHGMAAWYTLTLRYKGALDLRVVNLLERLQRVKWKSGEHLTTYFSRVRQLVQELAAHNHAITDTMHSLYIMQGLPRDPEFDQFSALNRVQLDNSPEATEERLRRFLLKSEKYKLMAGDESICEMQGYGSDSDEEEIELARAIASQARAAGACFSCGAQGHLARNCPKRAASGGRFVRSSAVRAGIRLLDGSDPSPSDGESMSAEEIQLAPSMFGTRRSAICEPGRNASTPMRSTVTPPLILRTSVPFTGRSAS